MRSPVASYSHFAPISGVALVRSRPLRALHDRVLQLLKLGALCRTRTDTPFLAQGPKPSASTNFTKRAYSIHLKLGLQCKIRTCAPWSQTTWINLTFLTGDKTLCQKTFRGDRRDSNPQRPDSQSGVSTIPPRSLLNVLQGQLRALALLYHCNRFYCCLAGHVGIEPTSLDLESSTLPLC